MRRKARFVLWQHRTVWKKAQRSQVVMRVRSLRCAAQSVSRFASCGKKEALRIQKENTPFVALLDGRPSSIGLMLRSLSVRNVFLRISKTDTV